MRIAYIIPEFKKGGAERLCIDICIELQKQKIDFILIILKNVNLYPELTKNIKYVYSQNTFNLSLLKKNKINISHLNQLINDFKPDIIHSHLFYAEIISQCINYNCTRFFHVHDGIKQLNKFSIKTVLNKTLITNYYERLFYIRNSKKNNTFYLCISNNNSYIISKKLKNPNIILLNNAINTSKFFPVKRKKSKKLSLITIGSLNPNKGHSFLLKAIKRLTEMCDYEIEFNILGDGLIKNSLIDETQSLGLQKIVNFLGFKPNPEQYLQNSNLYIHGAISEAFGLVLIEAMSTGIPVITTNAGGNVDFMNETNGVLINNRNSYDFAKEIKRVFEDENLYKKLSQGAIKTSKKYDIVDYTENLISIYKEKTVLKKDV